MAFFRGAAAFAGVARNAAADRIFPGVRPAFGTRDDVIDRRVFFRKFLAAVLTGVFIALENVLARITDAACCDGEIFDVAFEFDDLRKLKRPADGANETIVGFYEFGFFGEKENHGLLPTNDPNRLVARVQNECPHASLTSRSLALDKIKPTQQSRTQQERNLPYGTSLVRAFTVP